MSLTKEKHPLNIHVPKSMFDKLNNIRNKTGMPYTEFANRAISNAMSVYESTGELPSKEA